MIINWIGWSNNIWNERDLYNGMIYTKEKLREMKFEEREREWMKKREWECWTWIKIVYEKETYM